MNQMRYGLNQRWAEQFRIQGEQKVGGVERTQGLRRKDKTICSRRESIYRYGERRKRWDQQYGVYVKRPMRGRALGTKRGRTLRARRNGVDYGKTWEKRDRGRRRIQNSRTLRDVNNIKRRERQHKRIWNEQRRRINNRSQVTTLGQKVIRLGKTVSREQCNPWLSVSEELEEVEDVDKTEDRDSCVYLEEREDLEEIENVEVMEDLEFGEGEEMGNFSNIKTSKKCMQNVTDEIFVGLRRAVELKGGEEQGRYIKEIAHRVIGMELWELNVMFLKRNDYSILVFGPEGRRQELKEHGGERVRRTEKNKW